MVTHSFRFEKHSHIELGVWLNVELFDCFESISGHLSGHHPQVVRSEKRSHIMKRALQTKLSQQYSETKINNVIKMK